MLTVKLRFKPEIDSTWLSWNFGNRANSKPFCGTGMRWFFDYNKMFTVMKSLFSCFSLFRIIFWWNHNFSVWAIPFLVLDPCTEVCHVLFRLKLQVSGFEIPFSGSKPLFMCFSGWTKNFSISGFRDSIFRFQIPVHVFFRLNKEFSGYGILFFRFRVGAGVGGAG